MQRLPHLLAIAALVACERDPRTITEPSLIAPALASSEPESIAVVAHEPAVPLPAGDPIFDVQRDRTGRRRRVRIPEETELPQPPSDEPATYAAWLTALPAPDRARVKMYCRAHRLDYQFVCGGIGPLHIPVPPFAVPRAAGELAPQRPPQYFASYAAWERSLSRAQRRYVARACPNDEDRPSSELCGPNTPLVIAWHGQPVRFATGGRFAFQPGVPVATDWPTASTPWLALDRDGNGTIDSGAELFGSDTRLPDGRTAANGFAALAPLDANGDGRIDARDPAFASLVLWADRDFDQRSTPDELTPASDLVVAISLAYTSDVRCDARGNCEGERATLTWRTADGAVREGAIVDIYLPVR